MSKNKKPLKKRGFKGGPTCPQMRVILLLIINELGFISGSQCEPFWFSL
jgi:hypothetical protein